MKIRPHINCEYLYYYFFYICVKTKNFSVYCEDEAEGGSSWSIFNRNLFAYRPGLLSLSIPHDHFKNISGTFKKTKE